MTAQWIKSSRRIVSILVVVVFFWIPVIDNGFVYGWDDEQQITQNADITSLNTEHIKHWFTTFYVGMYQPVTTFTYALDYQVDGLNPKVFHFTNFLLHLLNVVLVFILLKKISGNEDIALGAALLFGLHPMNVETVAWLSARSNLLFSAFFMASLIAWREALEKKSAGLKGWSFLFFVLSLLSKAPAVTLFAVLILMDYYYGRRDHRRIWLEKIPFFLLSVVFVVIAVKARAEVSHLGHLSDQYNPFQSLVIISWSYAFYLFKLIWPFHTSAIYYYPGLFDGSGLQPVHYAGAALAWGFFAWVIFLIYKTIKNKQKPDFLLFGLLFFLINITVIIHFIPVGIQVVAERYVYLPYVGLFFILLKFLTEIDRENKKFFVGLWTLFFLLTAVFGFTSSLHIRYWKDTETLMQRVISENPKAWHALVVRGDGYFLENKNQQALADYNMAAQRAPAYPNLYLNRGNVLARQSRFQEAEEDFTRAIRLDSSVSQAWFNRALAYFNQGKYRQAVEDLNRSLKIKPGDDLALLYRGMALGMLKKYDEAFTDLNQCVVINPKNARGWFSLAVLAYKKNNFESAEKFYSKAIELNPGNGMAWYQRGLTRVVLHRNADACADFKKAVSLGIKQARNYAASYCDKTKQ